MGYSISRRQVGGGRTRDPRRTQTATARSRRMGREWRLDRGRLSRVGPRLVGTRIAATASDRDHALTTEGPSPCEERILPFTAERTFGLLYSEEPVLSQWPTVTRRISRPPSLHPCGGSREPPDLTRFSGVTSVGGGTPLDTCSETRTGGIHNGYYSSVVQSNKTSRINILVGTDTSHSEPFTWPKRSLERQHCRFLLAASLDRDERVSRSRAPVRKTTSLALKTRSG